MIILKSLGIKIYDTFCSHQKKRTVLNMNNTSNQGCDLSHVLFENRSSKIFSLIFSGVSSAIGLVLVYSIIWFDKFGSDRKRTVLNLFFCRSVYIASMFLCFIQIPEIARYSYGPLPAFICSGQEIFRNVFVTSVILFVDATTAVRYAFIFWLKNPAAFYDDFWCSFISSWIYGFSFMFCGTWYYQQTHQTFGFYICTGQDSMAIKNNINVGSSLLVLMSFLLNTFAYLKIFVYKKKSTVMPVSRGFFLKSLMLTQIEEQSLSTFVTRLPYAT